MDAEKLQKMINDFNAERGWLKYHNHKDIMLAIVEEVGELSRLVVWKRQISGDLIREMEGEIADIFIYLASFANMYNISISKCVEEKIKVNEQRFPLNGQTGEEIEG